MWAVSENVRIHFVCLTVFCKWKCGTWKQFILGDVFAVFVYGSVVRGRS